MRRSRQTPPGSASCRTEPYDAGLTLILGCDNEKAFLTLRAALALCRLARRSFSRQRCARVLADQHLRIQRFPLPPDQQYSGRPRHSRFSEHDGKQGRPGGLVWGSLAATVVIPSRRESCTHVLLALRRSVVLLLVYRRVDRHGLQVLAEGTAGPL